MLVAGRSDYRRLDVDILEDSSVGSAQQAVAPDVGSCGGEVWARVGAVSGALGQQNRETSGRLLRIGGLDGRLTSYSGVHERCRS